MAVFNMNLFILLVATFCAALLVNAQDSAAQDSTATDTAKSSDSNSTGPSNSNSTGSSDSNSTLPIAINASMVRCSVDDLWPSLGNLSLALKNSSNTVVEDDAKNLVNAIRRGNCTAKDFFNAFFEEVTLPISDEDLAEVDMMVNQVYDNIATMIPNSFTGMDNAVVIANDTEALLSQIGFRSYFLHLVITLLKRAQMASLVESLSDQPDFLDLIEEVNGVDANLSRARISRLEYSLQQHLQFAELSSHKAYAKPAEKDSTLSWYWRYEDVAAPSADQSFWTVSYAGGKSLNVTDYCNNDKCMDNLYADMKSIQQENEVKTWRDGFSKNYCKIRKHMNYHVDGFTVRQVNCGGIQGYFRQDPVTFEWLKSGSDDKYIEVFRNADEVVLQSDDVSLLNPRYVINLTDSSVDRVTAEGTNLHLCPIDAVFTYCQLLGDLGNDYDFGSLTSLTENLTAKSIISASSLTLPRMFVAMLSFLLYSLY